MEEHESKFIGAGEYYYVKGITERQKHTGIGHVYIDSNDFLHSLLHFAWRVKQYETKYYIHGQCFDNKQDWEIERNRLLMLEEIEL